jgi:aminopeptidase N
MLAIGKYDKKEGISKNKIPLEWYIEPIDSSKFETTYCYSQKMFDYLNKKIGVKYPWQVYRQVPVRDFVYAGMENTTATIFAREYVVDNMGYNDQNYINVNAHELAHQWFGDLITATEGKHHWLQEGFATYYALMAEKNIFGEDHYYSSLYNNWLKIRTASSRDTIPILNEKASSLSFYQKGAWALHALKEDIGERKFDKAVKKYLKKYAFQNVKTDDFLNEIKKVAPRYDVLIFQKKWLENGKFDSIYNPYLKKWKQYKYLEMVRASSTWQNNQKDS